jgi:hypothetical protein
VSGKVTGNELQSSSPGLHTYDLAAITKTLHWQALGLSVCGGRPCPTPSRPPAPDPACNLHMLTLQNIADMLCPWRLLLNDCYCYC